MLTMSDKTYPDIAARLRSARKAFSEMNRKEWAEANGFNATQYTNWENGTRRVPIDSAAILCDRYGLTLDWIYRGRLDGLSSTARSTLNGLSRSA